MARKRKPPPPSRARYDESHPVVSARVTREMLEQIEMLCFLTGKSVGDILREALDEQMPSVGKATDTGYELAKNEFAVTYKCSVCGGNIILSSAAEKAAAAQYMREQGWGHGECHEKRRPKQ